MNSGLTGFRRLVQDRIDLRHCGVIDRPTERAGNRRKLLGTTRTPQGDICMVAVEHPAYGKMDDPPAEPVDGPAEAHDVLLIT
jgi:hypothetical protein